MTCEFNFRSGNHGNSGVSGGGGVVKKSSKKRRRVASMAQRRAANIRERRRMFNLNEAFDRLRTKVEKKESLSGSPSYGKFRYS